MVLVVEIEDVAQQAFEDLALMPKVADAILGLRPSRLEYRGCLPLCPRVSFRGADRSREGFLVGSKRRALVIPLALPEWRAEQPSDGGAFMSHRCTGELRQTAGGLELCQSADARHLYAPLFFDLERRRMTRPLTWRPPR